MFMGTAIVPLQQIEMKDSMKSGLSLSRMATRSPGASFSESRTAENRSISSPNSALRDLPSFVKQQPDDAAWLGKDSLVEIH